MAIVSILKEVIKVGIKLNRKYRYLNINDKFVRKYVPPGYRSGATKAIRVGEAIALGIPIYDLVADHYRTIPKPKYNQNRQTRNNMVRSRYQRFRRSDKNYCIRPNYGRKRRRY